MAELGALEALQARLRVQFRDLGILQQALRHRSATLENPSRSNERLEFLGDSLVGLVICEYLFARFPDLLEGELAKRKAYLASEPVFAEVALALGLDQVIEMSFGEEASGGRGRPSILSDAFEAVIAAVYLDQGIRSAKALARRALAEALTRVDSAEYHQDFKSQLQEKLQATIRKTPQYRIKEETGADHDKTFVARVLAGRKVLGEGAGKSKKQAEQAAARSALESLRD